MGRHGQAGGEEQVPARSQQALSIGQNLQGFGERDRLVARKEPFLREVGGRK
jgi:hypothetical protein